MKIPNPTRGVSVNSVLPATIPGGAKRLSNEPTLSEFEDLTSFASNSYSILQQRQVDIDSLKAEFDSGKYVRTPAGIADGLIHDGITRGRL
jgi:hypothetical protein